MIEKFFQKYKKSIRLIYINRVVIIIFFILMIIGAYTGYLLFGTNSLEVLISVKDKRTSLQENVQTLQYENAKLQKQLFELKGLEP
ncbi:hypothetical protein [Helicobacter sp. 13S00477-4]|uniref:hypothetical protein n=1 Tax=Helicobacter sp. 13S00477-4 TaxID=1905759 RepID=UPI000BCEF781|nr:hypothetical protein [Helicobacter sp. 13S00477-4]PAF50448.1 hypothetical protein BKH44_08250 [Helicobacter sp. 13S00477-4]